MNSHQFLVVLQLLFYSSVIFIIAQETIPSNVDPACYYSMVELVCSEGYHIQEHTLETVDGYILAIFRIPNGKRRPKVAKRRNHYSYMHTNHHPDFDVCFIESMNQTSEGPVVLLVHGLSGASDGWVVQGPDHDLAFILADRGYDVWFMNVRGNFYSKRHKTLKPSEKAFWDYSFHESGVHDMTETVDYILNLRGIQKLYYVGHSMGTTMFYVMTSLKPEYNEKIHLFVGLAPVSQLRISSVTRAYKRFLNFIVLLLNAFSEQGTYELLPRNPASIVLARIFCSKGSPFQNICYDACFFYTGHYSKLYIREKFSVYLTHGISGTSLKTVQHFAQMLYGSPFQFYDYGPEENLRRYSQTEPPLYNLSRVTAPVALFNSKGDYVSVVKDVEKLKSHLPNVIFSEELTHYNHIDFLWAYDARTVLYYKVIDLMEQFKTK